METTQPYASSTRKMSALPCGLKSMSAGAIRSFVRVFEQGFTLSHVNVKGDFGRSCDWIASMRSVPFRACASQRMRESVSMTSPFMRDSFGTASQTSSAPTM